MSGALSSAASEYILGGAIARKTSHLSILLQPGITITRHSKSSKVSSIQLSGYKSSVICRELPLL
jgi:hypothetical protein